jgi:hypothetical protein
MKLIALKNFTNNCELEIPAAKHPRFVHKGARFSIGGDAPVDKISSKADKALIGQLAAASCAGDAGDPKTVKRVEDEIAEDKAREESDAKALKTGKPVA